MSFDDRFVEGLMDVKCIVRQDRFDSVRFTLYDLLVWINDANLALGLV